MTTIVLVPGGPGLPAGYLEEVPFPPGLRLEKVRAGRPAGMLRDLVRRCAEADGDCYLFGHSAGVLACLLAAGDLPPSVRGAVFACGQAASGTDSPDLLRANLAMAEREPWHTAAVRAMQATPRLARGWDDDELRDLAIAMLRLAVGWREVSHERFFSFCAAQWDMGILRAELSDQNPVPDLTPRARGFPVPVLVLQGAMDPWAGPASGHALHGLLPGSSLRIIPRAGHLPWLDNRAEVHDALARFLTVFPHTGSGSHRELS